MTTVREEGMSEEPADTGAETPATGLFALAVLALMLVLLLILPFATSGQPMGKSWFLSPRNAPLAAILVTSLGAGLMVAQFFRSYALARDRRAFLAEAFRGFDGSLDALLYCALFGLYVLALGYVGFAFSTLLFGQACLWVCGLRSLRWAGWNLFFTVMLVVILRVFMGLWFPQAPVLDFVPASIANTIGPYL